MKDVEDRESEGGGYAHQYRSRRSIPSSNQPNTMTKRKRPIKSANATPSDKSLVNLFRHQGVKLCDGSKINAVSKGLKSIGVSLPSVVRHVTSLYLSQNDLCSLRGIDQFSSLRLLSIGGNLLNRIDELSSNLKGLVHLRHLNLVGNPLCEQPNYRFRAIDALPQIHVLDTVEISKKEREIAAVIASQDHALREMVIGLHIDIYKIQFLASWIPVLSELHCVVFQEAASSNRFDQLPNPLETSFHAERFVRIWRYQDTMSGKERVALELHMISIVIRTYRQLATHPKLRAKALLLHIAKATPSMQGNVSNIKDGPTWEDAYHQVIQLQQQTLVHLQGQCERARQEMIKTLRTLLMTEPSQRRRRRLNPRPNLCLEGSPERNLPIHIADVDHGIVLSKQFVHGSPNYTRAKTKERAMPSQLRCGQFSSNKTLHEAVQTFTLRDQVAKAPVQVQQHASRPMKARSVPVLQYDDDKEMALQENQVDDYEQYEASETVWSFDDTRHASSMKSQDEIDSLSSPRYSTRSHHTLPSPVAPSPIPNLQSPMKLTRQHPSHLPPSTHAINKVDGRERKEKSVRTREQQYVMEEDILPPPPPPRTSPPPHSPTEIELNRWSPPSSRQSELEERESKYIRALMESEQRELDLRHELSAALRQATQYRQTLNATIEERADIKRQVRERVDAIAKPLIQRRFLQEWKQWCKLSQHFKQMVQRATNNVLLYHFSTWRRQGWVQQALRRIRKRRNNVFLHDHFTEWVNLARITVIGIHTQAVRSQQLLTRIFQEWRQHVEWRQSTNAIIQERALYMTQSILRTHFDAWKCVTRQWRQLVHVQHYPTRVIRRLTKRVVLREWRIYVLAIAKPCRVHVDAMVTKRHFQRVRNHFLAWLKVTQSRLLYYNCVLRRVFTTWIQLCHTQQSEHLSEQRARKVILREHMMEWRIIASDKASRRRALGLAKHFVHHRRLRKVWMYWKIYSIARKRYVQGSSKAIKHYIVKLIRRSWRTWHEQTRANLCSVKQHRWLELRRHFEAFRVACIYQAARTKRERRIQHMIQRRCLKTERTQFLAWSELVHARKRSRVYAKILQHHRSKNLLSFVWSCWRREMVLQLQQHIATWTQQCDVIKNEQQELEDEVMMSQDKVRTVEDRMTSLNEQLSKQDEDLTEYKRLLQERELEVGQLVKELDTHTTKEEQLMDQLRQYKAQERDAVKQQVVLQSENENFLRRVDELSRAVETQQHTTRSLKDEKKQLLLENELERVQNQARVHALEDEVKDLQQQLETEQKERENVANRLQEYEQRLATTCDEISQQEQAHDDELNQLRQELELMQNRWKEENVRNIELQRLVSEKNDQIIKLTLNFERNLPIQPSSPSPPPTEEGKSPTVTDGEQMNALIDAIGKSILKHASHESRQIMGEKSSTDEQRLVLPSPCLEATDERGGQHHVSCPTSRASVEEQLIDLQTSKIHDDLKMLQERITKRLQSSPSNEWDLAPAPRRVSFKRASSCTSSSFESDTTTPVSKQVTRKKRNKSKTRMSKRISIAESENSSSSANRIRRVSSKQQQLSRVEELSIPKRSHVSIKGK